MQADELGLRAFGGVQPGGHGITGPSRLLQLHMGGSILHQMHQHQAATDVTHGQRRVRLQLLQQVLAIVAGQVQLAQTGHVVQNDQGIAGGCRA